MDVARLLKDIIDSQHSIAAKNSADLLWSWHNDPVNLIVTDPNRLQPILMNLTRNAVKFTKDGDVRVSVAVVDGNVALNDVAEEARKVAGSAAVFGVIDIRDGLNEIETLAKSGDRDARPANALGRDQKACDAFSIVAYDAWE